MLHPTHRQIAVAEIGPWFSAVCACGARTADVQDTRLGAAYALHDQHIQPASEAEAAAWDADQRRAEAERVRRLQMRLGELAAEREMKLLRDRLRRLGTTELSWRGEE